MDGGAVGVVVASECERCGGPLCRKMGWRE